MEQNTDQKSANKWLSVPIIAAITRLLCRELTLQTEYLRLEDKILKSKINKRIVFPMMNAGHQLSLPWRWAKT